MIRGKLLAVGLLCAICATESDAKVFSYNNSPAAYLRGGAALSSLRQDAFSNSSGVSTDLGTSEVQYNVSAEMGALISRDKVNLRLGIELLRPKDLLVTGKNSAGTQDLFELNSEIFVYSPVIGIEYIYSVLGSTRFYGALTAGYGYVTLDNAYELTADGLTAFNPVTSHTEKASAEAMHYQLGMGFETLFTDNVTFTLDFGYRHFVVDNFKHKAPNTTIAQGAVTKGDPVLNHDGSKRKLDLGGLTVNAAFRFYLNF